MLSKTQSSSSYVVNRHADLFPDLKLRVPNSHATSHRFGMCCRLSMLLHQSAQRSRSRHNASQEHILPCSRALLRADTLAEVLDARCGDDHLHELLRPIINGASIIDAEMLLLIVWQVCHALNDLLSLSCLHTRPDAATIMVERRNSAPSEAARLAPLHFSRQTVAQANSDYAEMVATRALAEKTEGISGGPIAPARGAAAATVAAAANADAATAPFKYGKGTKSDAEAFFEAVDEKRRELKIRHKLHMAACGKYILCGVVPGGLVRFADGFLEGPVALDDLQLPRTVPADNIHVLAADEQARRTEMKAKRDAKKAAKRDPKPAAKQADAAAAAEWRLGKGACHRLIALSACVSCDALPSTVTCCIQHFARYVCSSSWLVRSIHFLLHPILVMFLACCLKLYAAQFV